MKPARFLVIQEYPLRPIRKIVFEKIEQFSTDSKRFKFEQKSVVPNFVKSFEYIQRYTSNLERWAAIERTIYFINFTKSNTPQW